MYCTRGYIYLLEREVKCYIDSITFFPLYNSPHRLMIPPVVLLVISSLSKLCVTVCCAYVESVYSGEDNPLQMEERQTISFRCHFELQMYPFDTQNCSIFIFINDLHVNFTKLLKVQSFHSARYIPHKKVAWGRSLFVIESCYRKGIHHSVRYNSQYSQCHDYARSRSIHCKIQFLHRRRSNSQGFCYQCWPIEGYYLQRGGQ